MTLNLPKIDGYWYVGTPYTKYPDGHRKAWVHACYAAAQIAKTGASVLCPIAQGHPMHHYGNLPIDAEFWSNLNRPLVTNAAGVIVVKMPGWQDSTGLQEEIRLAIELEIPVIYVEWPIES